MAAAHEAEWADFTVSNAFRLGRFSAQGWRLVVADDCGEVEKEVALFVIVEAVLAAET